MSRHATAEDLSAYVDRELPPVRLRLVKEHLEECGECRRQVEGMRRLVSDLRRLERLEPPPALGTSLHRRIVLKPRPRGLVERLESRLGGLSLQPSVGFTFALVFAFAAILYLFAGSLDRHERLRIPVLRPYPPPAASSEEGLSEVRELAGRSFRFEGGVWREQGPPVDTPVIELPADGAEGLAVTTQVPGLAQLLAEGSAVELRHEGQVVRLTPAVSADAASERLF